MDKTLEKTVEQKLEEELNGEPGGSDVTPKLDEPKVPAQEGTPPTYTLSWLKNDDGSLKQLSAEQVVEETNRVYSDNSKISGELSKLKKVETVDPQSPSGDKPTLSKEDQAVLDELKTKFGVLTQSEVADLLAKAKTDFVREAVQVASSQGELKEALNQLEEDYDGSEVEVNGVKVNKPKVDQKKVLQFIVDNPKTDKSPLEIAKFLYVDDFINYEAKTKGGASKSELPTTESGGVGGGEPPEQRPYGFKDGSAEKAVAAIIQ